MAKKEPSPNGQKEMLVMNKIMKRIIASFMLVITTVYFLPVQVTATTETVYSKLDSNGSNYKTIVTTKNENEITQQDSDKELPLETKITYFLNGEEISSEDLIGKNGKVKIKIEYENKLGKEVIIDGEQETIYTPFIVMLGTIIDNNNNTNIKVSNGGKIIENGEKTIVIGAVFPGLEESLDLRGELKNINIPSSLEIEMDSTNFEMKNILTYATPKILTEDIDWSKFDNLFDQVNELQNGIDKIEEGSKELANGTKELKDGANSLSEGITSVYNGSEKLKTQVEKSIKSLEDDNSDAIDEKTLNTIAQKAGKSAASTIEKKLSTIQNQATQGVSKEIEEQLDEIGEQASKAAIDTIEKQVEATYNNIKQEITTNKKETISKLSSQIETAIKSTIKSIDVSAIANYKDILNNNEEYNSLDKETKEKFDSIFETILDSVVKKVAEKTAQITIEEISKVVEKEDFSTLTQSFVGSLAKNITDNIIGSVASSVAKNTATTVSKQVASQVAGTVAKQVAEDTAEQTAKTVAKEVGNQVKVAATKNIKSKMQTLLDEGITPLSEGLEKINKGAIELSSGTRKLNNGTIELNKGIHKYNAEGISKISKIVNNELKNLEIRAKKLKELSDEYNSFNSDEKMERVAFISITDSVKRKEE